MKKTGKLLVILFIGVQLLACKTDKKEASESQPKTTQKSNAAYVLNDAKKSVEWIAYKTTEKIPVKAKFKKVNITGGGEGNTVKEAINNAEFSIPVSSIFTADTSRDYKIRKFFFGVMENTNFLSGKLMIDTDSTGYANITMNGITKKLPFDYTIQSKEFKMEATMNILNWNAQSSIDSLNAACKELHKGLDGVSKTWSEVAIKATVTF